MRLKIATIALAAASVIAALPAWAHHGFGATFDANKPISIKGVITKVELMNPHSWFWVDVKNPDGTVVNWGFEGGSPNSLIRHGVTKDSLPVGTVIVVTGYQAKSADNKGVAVTMTTTDGKKLFLGGSMPPGVDESGKLNNKTPSY